MILLEQQSHTSRLADLVVERDRLKDLWRVFDVQFAMKGSEDASIHILDRVIEDEPGRWDFVAKLIDNGIHLLLDRIDLIDKEISKYEVEKQNL